MLKVMLKLTNKKEKLFNLFWWNKVISEIDELIFANGNSRAIDNDVEIDANNFEYNNLSNIIYAKGNVKINNKKENYLIFLMK